MKSSVQCTDVPIYTKQITQCSGRKPHFKNNLVATPPPPSPLPRHLLTILFTIYYYQCLAACILALILRPFCRWSNMHFTHSILLDVSAVGTLFFQPTLQCVTSVERTKLLSLAKTLSIFRPGAWSSVVINRVTGLNETEELQLRFCFEVVFSQMLRRYYSTSEEAARVEGVIWLFWLLLIILTDMHIVNRKWHSDYENWDIVLSPEPWLHDVPL